MRHKALDLVRGLAAVGVALYHWVAWSGGVVVQSLGTFTVYLFFILSALTMAIVYGDRFEQRIEYHELRVFIRNRVARLLPLLILMASVYFVIGHFSSPGKALLTGTGLFALGPPGYLSNVGGAWSLGIELAFYAVLPPALLLIGGMTVKRTAAVTLAVLLAQQAYLATIATVEPHWDYYTVPLTFAPFFALGFLIFKLGGSRSTAFLLLTLAGLGLIGCFSLIWPANLFRSPFPHVVLMMIAAFTMYAANRSLVPAPLERPAEFLGEISYALYLTHPLTYVAIRKLGFPQPLELPIFVTVAMVVAFATYRVFEFPMRLLLRGQKSLGATLRPLAFWVSWRTQEDSNL